MFFLPLSVLFTVWPLFLGLAVLMLGAGLQGTLLGVRATLEGFPTATIGVVMSCYYVGYLVGTIAAPRLIRSVGHIRVFAALAAVASAAAVSQAVFVFPFAWGVTRLVSGLCFAGIYVVAESSLNERATSATRARLLALYMVVIYLGLGSGQFLLLLADPRSPAPFMLISALISLAMVPMVLSAQPAPAVAARRSIRIRELYRVAPVGLITVTVAGLITSVIFSIGPVYARLNGLDTAGIATFMAVSIFAGVVTQYPIGALADHMDRRIVIAAVCLVAAIVASGLTVFPEIPRPLYLLLAALFSGLVLTIYSLGLSHVNDRIEPGQMVAASGALLLLNGGGAILGPMLAARLMAAWGPAAYFGTLASLNGALALYCLWRKVRRVAAPVAARGPFIKVQPQPCASVNDAQWLGAAGDAPPGTLAAASRPPKDDGLSTTP
jgi:MFS family permease